MAWGQSGKFGGSEMQGSQLARASGHTPFLPICAAVLAAFVVAGCSSKGNEDQASAVVTVQAATVERKTIQAKIKADAALYPRDQAGLVPKISAPIEKFYVDRGSHVHAGQLLATIENRDVAGALTETQGAYEQAQTTYSNAEQSSSQDLQLAKQQLDAAQQVYDARKDLYHQGAIAEKDLEDARIALTQAHNQYDIAEKRYNLKAASGELTSAKGKLASAEAQLSYTKIVSPITGVVTDRPFNVGDTPPSGSPILTVMDLSKVVARAYLSPQDAAQVHVGDSATLAAPGADGEVHGTVTVVSPAADPHSTTLQVWVEAANPRERLKPGSTVTLDIVARTVKDALVVPAEAVLTAPDGTSSVMLIGSDGIAHQTNVETGIHADGDVEIVKGLQLGQHVVTEGAYGLPDGTKVAVSNSAQPAAASEP